jgi:hypothetical protein
MPISTREHKGRKIIFGDFKNLSEPKSIENLEELARVIKSQPGKVLSVSDFSGAALGPAFMARAKALGKEVFEPKADKQALLGIDGLKKMLLSAYVKFTGSKMKPFEKEAEALDYLVS